MTIKNYINLFPNNSSKIMDCKKLMTKNLFSILINSNFYNKILKIVLIKLKKINIRL